MRYSPFERRRRAVSRFALYTSLVVAVVLFTVLVHWLGRPFEPSESRLWAETDFPSLPEVQLLRDYVRIDTTHETGDEIAGARFLARRIEAAGVPVHIEVLGHRFANLWAIIEGDDPRALVLHSHIDVEPIHYPESWEHPPFSGDIEGPWIYGRGTYDMKSVAIAQLSAFLDVARSRVKPRRSLIFLATSSEESGSATGIRWILREHPELVRRFWGVLTEGGWLEGRSNEDIKYWGVEFNQKRFADVTLCSPTREPLEDVEKRLAEIGHKVTGLRLTEDARIFLRSYAKSRDLGELRDLMEHPDRLLHDPATFAGELPPYIQSLFRDEVVPLRLEEAPGGGWELLLKVHLLAGSDPRKVLAEQLPGWLTFGLGKVVYEADPPHQGSPLDHPLYRAAVKVLEDNYPRANVGPLFLPWTATDSRFLRAAGIPSYGFSPFIILTTDSLRVSEANERISLPGYVEGVRLYRELVRRVVGDNP